MAASAAVAMVAVAMVAFAVGVVAVVVAVAVVCFAALGEYATRRLGPGRTPFLFAGAWRWLEARTAGPFLRWLGALEFALLRWRAKARGTNK